ncbi:hypothetical protein CDAR_236781 [Caerostris darwini]|uniref:Uncharacterized protein n=1 Tax=Caerostris darwini TaxID=1538125 RepID=A0AAV4S372_9ARAC|nr:hypothetical protein CDAR_236781 [Caerostris darwini]
MFQNHPKPKNEHRVHLLHATVWKALKKEAHPFSCRRSVWHKWNAAAVVTDHWVIRRAPVRNREQDNSEDGNPSKQKRPSKEVGSSEIFTTMK